jgi:hypothetical protein
VSDDRRIGRCPRCKGEIKRGRVIVTEATGSPDFAAVDEVVTMSLDPSKPRLLECWKCADCGASFT